jgi:hypothetical protein
MCKYQGELAKSADVQATDDDVKVKTGFTIRTNRIQPHTALIPTAALMGVDNGEG